MPCNPLADQANPISTAAPIRRLLRTSRIYLGLDQPAACPCTHVSRPANTLAQSEFVDPWPYRRQSLSVAVDGRSRRGTS